MNEPNRTRRELPPEAWLPLLREALAQQGCFTFPLRGSSMCPTLPEACEIDIVPVAASLRLGQLIVFVAGDALIAHRLVRRGEAFWIAQGDNRRGPDGPLRPEQVLGIVSAARVDGRHVWPRRRESLWAAFWLARYRFLCLPRQLARRARRSMRR